MAARDDDTLPLVAGIALVTGAVAWALWPKAVGDATLRSYAPTPEGPMSNATMPPFLAAAPAAGAARERYFEANVDAPTWVDVPLGNGVVIRVSNDYMQAQGIRVPLWPSTAQRVADRFGAMLPTKKLVDTIWRAATVKVEPRPMNYRPLAGDDVRVIAQHEAIVDGQVAGRTGLIDGPLKNYIVGRALTTPAAVGKQYLYGWHRLNGEPIQPVFGGHSARFSDYAAGTRLISKTAYLNGQPVALESLFASPQYAPMINESGVLPANALRYPTA
jgi:hypothetical protein